jgi:hypothetical protein
MSATTASDSSGVEYFFDCTSPGGHDSGWQDSPTYTDTGLTAATEYSYRVRARDKSAAQTATAWSATASAATTNTPRGTLPFAPRPKTIAYSGHFVVGFWAPPHLIEVWGGASTANFPFSKIFFLIFSLRSLQRVGRADHGFRGLRASC